MEVQYNRKSGVKQSKIADNLLQQLLRKLENPQTVFEWSKLHKEEVHLQQSSSGAIGGQPVIQSSEVGTNPQEALDGLPSEFVVQQQGDRIHKGKKTGLQASVQGQADLKGETSYFGS